jgi:hypothetical protein
VRRLLLVLPLLLAGCGGGDDDAKADYVAAASAVCERGEAEADALTAPTGTEGLADYADEVVRIADAVREDLEALEPPEDDAEELRTRVLEPFADVVEQGRSFAEQVRAAGDDTAKLLPLLSEAPDAGEVDVEYLREYGLDACAEAVETG